MRFLYLHRRYESKAGFSQSPVTVRHQLLYLGAILVFLPGFDDIFQMRDKINTETWPLRRPVIFTLHSQMNSFDQQKVFDAVGQNERKVVSWQLYGKS